MGICADLMSINLNLEKLGFWDYMKEQIKKIMVKKMKLKMTTFYGLAITFGFLLTVELQQVTLHILMKPQKKKK